MKNMKQGLCLISCLISILGVSANAAVDCSNESLAHKNVYQMPGQGYWMQAAGDCRMTYTAVGGISSFMYNMCTRTAEHITTRMDAFALPDGDIYMHPGSGMGLSFFSMEDNLRHPDGSIQAIYSDPAHIGYYESVGTLAGSTPQKRLIRVAMGNQGGSIRDYSIEKGRDAAGKDTFKFTPLTAAVTPVCRNLPAGGLDKQLPIISRDGQMIAGKDQNDMKMKVYRIEASTGNCTEVATIPMVTSKVSFSFDNKSVLYVIRDPNTGKGRLIQMNLETKALTTLSGPTEDVQYMTNRKDGTIFYTRWPTAGGANRNSVDLVELSPNMTSDVAEGPTYEALGLMWAAACNQSQTIDLDYALSVGKRLDKRNCETLLSTQTVAALPADYQNVSTDRLKNICGSIGAAAAAPGQGVH